MNFLKKSIVFLVALAFMPSPKAAAEEWSYGIKVGGATSWILPDTEKQKEALKQLSIKSSIWNPWFGTSLYMEYAFNNYIGVGTELLYNSFRRSTLIQRLETKVITSIQTIGQPVLLVWRWTAGIRPDFKEDYFLGRFFMGFHPFFCISRVGKMIDANNGKELGESDIPFDKNNPRFKLGFIGGTSFECSNGLLLEIKSMLPYNLLGKPNRDDRPFVASIHLSAGYNFSKSLA